MQLGLVQRVGSLEQASPALGCMVGPAVEITLRDDAVPYHCGVARRVPLPLQDKVKEELQPWKIWE